MTNVYRVLLAPSSYALNLKALIKVLKEILRYSFERKFDIDKLHFSEKDTSQKPMFFRFKKKKSKLHFWF